MSLVIGMKSSSAIILGADSRGTIGDPRGLTAINDTYKKIFSIGKFGIGFAGASELGATLLDELQKRNIDHVKDIDELVQRVFDECSQSFNKWFKGVPQEKWPAVLIVVTGYRLRPNQSPRPIIYQLVSQSGFAPALCDNSPCMMGVPQYAVYLVHRYYNHNIPKDRALALVEYLIAETASQDPKVGGPICLAEITHDSGYRELSTDEVDNIHKENAELNKNLKQFFLSGGQK